VFFRQNVSIEPPDDRSESKETAEFRPGVNASSPTAQVCADCGAALTWNSTGAVCLACSLRLALGEDELEDADADTNLAEGETYDILTGKRLRYGHFQVMLGPDDLPLELGSGAMGTTYRAMDTVLESVVALKVISQQAAGNPVARARFLREARAAAKLRHPNVATVSHYGEEDGECFYAMELVEGETLASRVNRLGRLHYRQALEIGVQVARALVAAEAGGVVHRDLKPSNLMLTVPPGENTWPDSGPNNSGRSLSDDAVHVKVIDWGLAKAITAQDTGPDHTRDGFVGTPAFASPEQFAPAAERHIDTRSDIYGLGVTLWYLLCGRTPFVGDTLEAIHSRQKELPMEQLKHAKAPLRLVEVICSMLAFDPADRPQSARELLEALRRCQQYLDPGLVNTQERGRPPRVIAPDPATELAETKKESQVFIVDDDASVRQSLGRLLRSVGHSVMAFASAKEFLVAAVPDGPSCLVLDVQLPGASGLELQKQLARIHREIPIVFITGHADVPTSVAAMKAGAIEFLTKPFREADLLETIDKAIQRDRLARVERAQAGKLREKYDSLTAREKEVMAMVVSGLLNKQVAAELGVAEGTIKVHRSQIMHKMQAESLADLVRMSDRLKQ
jgi:FixJ family two-component response regulator/tRNA A-37 threonylcarbamoyl transferase component Bud32